MKKDIEPATRPENQIFWNQQRKSFPSDAGSRLLMGEVSERLAIPRNRNSGLVPQSGQSRDRVSNSAAKRLQHKTLAIFKILDPSMTIAIPSSGSTHETRMVSHAQ